jgi:hypothetical protein
MSRKEKYAQKLVTFGNFYHLIDCLMLFGAGIESLANRNYRLRLHRTRDRGAPLGWAVMVAESQDPLFDFMTFNLDASRGIVRASTRTTRFLERSYERWYPKDQIKMPDDVLIDEPALLFWLLGSWHPTKMELPCRGMGDFPIINWRNWITAATGWGVHADKNKILIDAERGRVEKWLEARVPRKVWA